MRRIFVTTKSSNKEAHVKELKDLLVIECIALAAVLTSTCFATDIMITDVPAWFDMVMKMVLSVPYVGPFLMSCLKYIGIVAAVMTAISSSFMLVSKSLEKLALGTGFVAIADKIKKVYDLIFPWVGYLSIYNVPKPKKLI